MTGQKSVQIRFQLTGDGAAAPVDVCLRSTRGRWVATVEAPHRREVGLGATARQALNAALSPFSAATRTALASDPALIGASTQLLAAER